MYYHICTRAQAFWLSIENTYVLSYMIYSLKTIPCNHVKTFTISHEKNQQQYAPMSYNHFGNRIRGFLKQANTIQRNTLGGLGFCWTEGFIGGLRLLVVRGPYRRLGAAGSQRALYEGWGR